MIRSAVALLSFTTLNFASIAQAQTTIYENGFETNNTTGWTTNGVHAGSNPIQISTTPVGSRKFLGEFGTQTNTLTISQSLLPSNTNFLTLSFDLFMIRTWDGTGTNDFIDVGVDGGGTLLNATFSNNTSGRYEFTRQSYGGRFVQNGDFASRTGADESNTLGFRWTGDNEVRDSVYSFQNEKSYTFAFQPNRDLVLRFQGRIDGAPDASDETWGLDNVRITASPVPAPSTLITLLIGAVPGVAVLLRRRRK